MLRITDLRKALQKAANPRAFRIHQPKILKIQNTRGDHLMEQVASGNVRIIPSAWELDYTADALPTAATPAWTAESAGNALPTVSSGILSIEDE